MQGNILQIVQDRRIIQVTNFTQYSNADLWVHGLADFIYQAFTGGYGDNFADSMDLSDNDDDTIKVKPYYTNTPTTGQVNPVPDSNDMVEGTLSPVPAPASDPAE